MTNKELFEYKLEIISNVEIDTWLKILESFGIPYDDDDDDDPADEWKKK